MLKNLVFTAAFSGALLCLSSGLRAEIVSRVIDGDTFVTSEGDIVRMLEIDAPESHKNKRLKFQADKYDISEDKILSLGLLAKDRLSELVNNREVVIERKGKDKYGRTLAFIYNPDLVNLVLLEECVVWPYNKSGKFFDAHQKNCSQ